MERLDVTWTKSTAATNKIVKIKKRYATTPLDKQRSSVSTLNKHPTHSIPAMRSSPSNLQQQALTGPVSYTHLTLPTIYSV